MCHKKAKFEHPRKSPRRHYIIHNHENMSVQTPIRHTSGKRRQRSLPVALLPTAFHFYFIIQYTPFSGRRVSALYPARSQTSQVPQALMVPVPSPLSVVPSSADVQHPSPSAFELEYP